MRKLIIAIDGPSGAGKGTVARALARALHYRHVDTGAMYRALGWKATHEGVPLDDAEALARMAAAAQFDLEDGVRIDGHDVTDAIRNPEIDRSAAAVAGIPGVRRALVERQRALGDGAGVVMEGRDIGTVVFPAADVKIYLDADPEERARRRASDPAHGGTGEMSEVASALAARDTQDRTRMTSPLTRADDAVAVDTTGMSIDAVVARCLEIVERRRKSVNQNSHE